MWRQTVPKEPDNGGRGYPVSSLPLPPPPTALSSGVGHPPTTTQMGTVHLLATGSCSPARGGVWVTRQVDRNCQSNTAIQCKQNAKWYLLPWQPMKAPAPVVCRAVSDITQLVHNVLVSAAAILSSSIRPLLVGGEEKHVSTCIGWVGLTPQCLNRHTHTHTHACMHAHLQTPECLPVHGESPAVLVGASSDNGPHAPPPTLTQLHPTDAG